MLILSLIVFIILQIILMLILFNLFSLTSINRAPYISIPNKVLPKIVDALNIQPNSVLYDCGSGDGRVLRACSQKEPQAKYIGLEMSLYPFMLSRLLNRRYGFNNIEIKKHNFFKTDFSSATHIFTYLYPFVMDSLLPKFNKELSPGTILVSCDFKFKNKQPIKVIDLQRAEKALGRVIYIYQF